MRTDKSTGYQVGQSPPNNTDEERLLQERIAQFGAGGCSTLSTAIKMRSAVFMVSGLITVLTGNFALSQPYRPFPDDAHWVVSCSTFNPEPFPGFSTITTIHYKLNGDTLINGLEFHKTEMTIELYPLIDEPFALRQDTIGRKVILYDYFTQNEYLLYDFSLQPGDFYLHTLDLLTNLQHCFDPMTDSLRLDSISMLTPDLPSGWFELGSYGLRTFYFSPIGGQSLGMPNMVWVEGMGSTVSPVGPVGGYDEFSSTWVRGFCTGDTTWAPFNETDCDLLVNVPLSSTLASSEWYWNGNGLIFKSIPFWQVRSVLMVNMLGETKYTDLNEISETAFVAWPSDHVQAGVWAAIVQYVDGTLEIQKVYIPN